MRQHILYTMFVLAACLTTEGYSQDFQGRTLNDGLEVKHLHDRESGETYLVLWDRNRKKLVKLEGDLAATDVKVVQITDESVSFQYLKKNYSFSLKEGQQKGNKSDLQERQGQRMAAKELDTDRTQELKEAVKSRASTNKMKREKKD